MATFNVLNKSTVVDLNICARLDSEYYQHHFIENDAILSKGSYFKIGQQYKVTDGEHGSVKYFSSGIRYLTAENIHDGFVDISNVRYVNEQVHKKNARASVNLGDVLISIKATLGQVALAEDWLPPCNMNRDVAIIKPLTANHSRTQSSYLSVFLMCKYGNIQAQRGGSGGVQQMITLERLRQFIVPSYSSEFYSRIDGLLMSAYGCRNNSIILYTDTEKFLLDTIGLSDFTPSLNKFSIRGLADSFSMSGRIDAEFYQQGYEDIETMIRSGEVTHCRINDGSFIPQKGDYKYIELADIGVYGNITSCSVAPFMKLPSRARRMVKTGQVIISSIEGSLSSCALISDEYDGALCSTGFFIAESTSFNPETLLILFKSAPIQALMKKWCSGTILAATTKSVLEKIPLPKIMPSDQSKIAANVQKSFALRSESEQLLKTAKHAVEMAIEDGEDAAIRWLDERG